MIIEVSVAVIALTFVILAIYMIFLLRLLLVTTQRVNRLLIDAHQKFDDVSIQATKAVEHTNQISFDLKKKMESLDPIFNSLSNVGEVLETKSLHFKKKALQPSETEQEESRHSINESWNRHSHAKAGGHRFRSDLDHESNKIAEILEIAGMGLRLWEKIKKRR